MGGFRLRRPAASQGKARLAGKAPARALVCLWLLSGCFLLLSGCFTWTEDSQGRLQSVGVPGLPLWQSSRPAAPLTPAALGFTPAEAAKFGGEVLVLPPTPPSRATRYRFYETGHNQCEHDLEEILADRARRNITGPPPYCTDHPTMSPAVTGQALIF
jgi:hypothetical protein